MNTKFVGHHISSGGFIFYKDKKTEILYVLLIKNKKNEYWIPKGHIEEGENHVAAAFREIEEEVGLNKKKLTYIGFSDLYRFSFTNDDGKLNTKEIYMNVFEADERYKLRIERGETDIKDARWFEYGEALEKILPFSKNELIKAKEIFENHLNNDFENARKDLLIQSFTKDLVCLIVFGSSVVNANTGKVPDDDLKKLTKYEICNLCKDQGILKKDTVVDFDNLESMYKLFQEINLYVVCSHTNKIKKKELPVSVKTSYLKKARKMIESKDK